jgi:hypothetical protein
MRVGFLLMECFKDLLKNYSYRYIPIPLKVDEDEIHLQKTIEWLNDACKNGKGGVSSHYSVLKGWLNPFPETTGYIIPTLYDYSYFSKNDYYNKLARDLTTWLGDVQLPEGGCMQGIYDQQKGATAPVVFNTGQNLLGFIRAYRETNNNAFLQNAIRAGDFLVASTDENGIWDKNLHRNLKHTINTRCSWSLLQLHQLTGDTKYYDVAIANLDWTLLQQTQSGWFHYGTSRKNGLPNTHFLSYTCEGFLESYKITGSQKYFDAAYLTAYKLLKIFENRKMLFAFWDEKWKNHGKYFKNSKGRFSCLTGNIQISIVWMQIYQLNKDVRFLNSAFKMLDFIKSLQDVNSGKEGICGGIKGSFPIYGSYSALMYPNWAAKYFCDAMMMKIEIKKEIEKSFSTEHKLSAV